MTNPIAIASGALAKVQGVLTKLGAIPTAITDTASFLEAIPAMISDVSAFHTFLQTSVSAAQDKDMSLEDKITAVLNDAEVFINKAFPGASASFDEVAAEIEAVVKEIFSLFESTKTLASAA